MLTRRGRERGRGREGEDMGEVDVLDVDGHWTFADER